MAAPSFLAIDVGGTSTRAAVVDGAGSCTGYAAGGIGNPTAVGPEAAAAVVADVVTKACAHAGVVPGAPAAVVVAIAGGQGPPGRALHERLVDAGLPAGLRFESDLLATYLSGTLAADGYAVVCGTGAIAARVRGGRLEVVADGIGWLLGDHGSGFWIGHRAVRAALAALDGVGPATSLSNAVLAELGIDGDAGTSEFGRPASVQQAVDALYRLRPTELAAFAPAAFTAAASGDAVARRIVDEAAAALAGTARAVIDAGVAGPIVLGGSVLTQQAEMARAVTDAYTAVGVTGPVLTVADGLVGAAVLALRAGGVEVSAHVFECLQATITARR